MARVGDARDRRSIQADHFKKTEGYKILNWCKTFTKARKQQNREKASNMNKGLGKTYRRQV